MKQPKKSAELLGDDVPLNPDGEPLEKGHGSAYARMTPHAKAHYHALVAQEAVEPIAAAANQLVALLSSFNAKLKEATAAAEAATKAPK